MSSHSIPTLRRAPRRNPYDPRFSPGADERSPTFVRASTAREAEDEARLRVPRWLVSAADPLGWAFGNAGAGPAQERNTRGSASVIDAHLEQ